MTEKELKDRTKKFTLRILRLANALPRTTESRIIGGQVIRCGTSVGANYRAACRARSSAEFIAKLGIVEEETDESAFWLEIIIEHRLMRAELVKPLLDEANELLSIFVSFLNIAKKNKKSKTNK